MKYVAISVVGLVSLLAGSYLMGGLDCLKFMAGYFLALAGGVAFIGVVFKAMMK